MLDGIAAGGLRPRPQRADGVSLAPKITVGDARVDWSEPSFAVDRRIRACTPAPGAWTELRGERVKLGPVKPLAEQPGDLGPGELRVSRTGVAVGTATTPVLLGEVRPQGKRARDAGAWARGARIGPGERFG